MAEAALRGAAAAEEGGRAGASPELARALAEAWHGGSPGPGGEAADPARGPQLATASTCEGSSALRSTSLEGALFAGRYRILQLLGSGAMGTVYEVLDLETERRRALKVMHPRSRPDDGERWRHEARIAGPLESPFIVDVLDVGHDDRTGRWFLLMELLHGEDLGRRLRRLGPRPAAEVALALHQAALALDRMHRAGVVHRDLKPANLFREEREGEAPRTKLLDLGVATSAHACAAPSIAGTPLYMAPEQFRDGAPVGPAADLFALGMVAFTLLAGRAYWADEWDRADDELGFALLVMRGPQEPACARAARGGVSLPPAFDLWFARATSPDPQQRFASAAIAVRALGAALAVELPPSPAAPPPSPAGSSAACTEATVERTGATVGYPASRGRTATGDRA